MNNNTVKEPREILEKSILKEFQEMLESAIQESNHYHNLYKKAEKNVLFYKEAMAVFIENSRLKKLQKQELTT